MKVAIVIADGVRQVMFTAENAMEKQALALLAKPGQDITVEFKEGNFFDRMPPSAYAYTVAESRGGHFRAYDASENALMLVLRDKPPAQAIEAESPEVEDRGLEAESAVPNGDAPNNNVN